MTPLVSTEFDREDLAEETSTRIPPPIEERLAFLPLGEGTRALVIGPLDDQLIENLNYRYQRVVSLGLGNGDAPDIDSRFNPAELIGSQTGARPELADLILILWPSVFIDGNIDWITFVRLALAPGGVIVIIEPADRPALPEQLLTLELFDLWVEYHQQDKSLSVNKPENYDIIERLSLAGAVHPRAKIFTDPDLLAASDSWLALTERFYADVSAQNSESANCLTKIDALFVRMKNLPPATPPIKMITTGFSSFRTGMNKKVARKPTDSDLLPYLPPIEIRESPVERLRFFGADYLRSSELLSLLLQPDSALVSDENPENIAAKILSEYGSRSLTAERNPGRMAELLGVTIEIASRVVAILELGRRFFEETTTRTPFIRSPEDAFKYLRDMALLKKEHLRGLYLNVQSRLIHDEVISIGTLSRSIVHPREVFAPALEHTAFAIILAHNHPSGDLTPSAQDIAVTKNISEAGRTLGIELLDHIIIGNEDFVSLKKEKLFS